MISITTLFSRREPPLLGVPLPNRLLAEMIGTALLVIFGPGSAVISAYQDGAITLEGIAAANGIIIMVLIYSVGHVSGAHFNPGVTIAFALFRHFQPREVAPYIAVQFFGGIIGAGILWALFGDALKSGVTMPSGSVAQGIGMEIVLTFLLMFVITAVATDVRAVGAGAAIAIGSAVGLDVLIGGPITGGSMNPARSLGPAFVSGEMDDLWIYLIAPPIGAILGAFAYTVVRADHHEP
ncbi:MAG TPA: MIP family channel protein [Dehalococcoidia bacterium]|nr:MIP family channel protein [Dehalococcoidia bacterium]